MHQENLWMSAARTTGFSAKYLTSELTGCKHGHLWIAPVWSKGDPQAGNWTGWIREDETEIVGDVIRAAFGGWHSVAPRELLPKRAESKLRQYQSQREEELRQEYM